MGKMPKAAAWHDHCDFRGQQCQQASGPGLRLPGNGTAHPSARVLEKLGFVRQGTLEEDCAVNGEVSDSWVYGLIRREWRPSPEPVPARLVLAPRETSPGIRVLRFAASRCPHRALSCR
jgi:hypothetical protein